MGCSSSQEDQVPLIGVDEGIQPVFEELKLVLIGCQGVGKNTVGNAILGDKIFTCWTSFRSDHIKETRTVSGTEIHLTRTPGWIGKLSNSDKAQMEIVHCVQSLYDTGPHAVLLALKVNSKLPESTIRTLESLFTHELWNHTIVIFTNGEQLGGYTIEDNIRCQQLQPLIDKCGQRYFDIRKNDGKQITDKIEELIIRKNSERAICFKLSDQREADEHEGDKLSNWKALVERTKSKIASILRFKEKLLSKQNQDEIEIKKLIDSKDEEIRRLNTIVEEKEREIERLQRSQDPDPIVHRRVAELEEKLDWKNREIMEKDTVIETLAKKVKERDTENEVLTNKMQILRGTARHQRPHEAHSGYRSKLSQDVTMMNSRGDTEIQLHDIPSNGLPLRHWSHTLLEILDKLSEDELKRIKYYLKHNEEYSKHMSSIERTDNRTDLADLMLKHLGDRQSVLITRDLMKKINRNDEVMTELFTPFLKKIGESTIRQNNNFLKEDSLFHHLNRNHAYV